MRTEPQIIYDYNGTLVVNLSDHPEQDLTQNERIRSAFQTCGIDPDAAATALLSKEEISSSESDQFADDAHTVLEEHVIERRVPTVQGEFSIFNVGYYPSADRHKDNTTVSAHFRDTEVILGAKGQGLLQIVPLQENDGNLAGILDQSVTVVISRNTLAILGPRTQANRWVEISEPNGGKPSFEVKYFAHPGPYDKNTKRNAKLE